MMTTLKSRRLFVSLAALLYLTAPLVNAIYYSIEESRGAYPPNSDTVAIPIYFFAIALLLLSPLYTVLVWLAARAYQGGLSLFVFDRKRPLLSGLWTLLICAIMLLCLSDAANKAARVLPLDVVYDLAWCYLLSCLRSSVVMAGRAARVLGPTL